MKKSSEIDALFALPAAEFTAARNTLAAQLKKEGRAEEAQRVKALTKPSATAWAVNQLYWRHRRDFDRLVALSEKVRQAQSGREGDLRSLADERRKLISDLASVAATLLSEGGHTPTIDVRRRVVTTLESLAARDRSGIELEAGRLTVDLEPLGFDGFAGLPEAKPLQKAGPNAKVIHFPQTSKAEKNAGEKRDIEAERAARARAEVVKRAESELASARREASSAEATASKAAARRDALEHEKQEIEARHAAAIQESREATEEARKAGRAVAEAERALDKARNAK